MSMLRMPPLVSASASRNLSSVRVLRDSDQTNLIHRLSQLSIKTVVTFPSTIRMGGGPRTFPGGVSKWQWKRMQTKKAKQLLKARLCRERQIYEMRKRAELRAAVSELERPWEVVERAPTLFSVSADEQLKTLADRFQRPGGYDLWSQRDGPQLFKNTADVLPSVRFFPKGVVHSIKPYGSISTVGFDSESILGEPAAESRMHEESIMKGRNRSRRSKKSSNRRGMGVLDSEGGDGGYGYFSRSDDQAVNTNFSNSRISKSREERVVMGLEGSDNMDRRRGKHARNGSSRGSRLRNKGYRQNIELGNLYESDSKQLSHDTEKNGRVSSARRAKSSGRRYNSGRDLWKPNVSHSREVYDMSLKHDGSYEFQTNHHNNMLNANTEDNFQLDSTS